MNNIRLAISPVLFILTATLYAAPSHSASFDCNKARTWVEKTICSNSELSQLDEALAKQYQDDMEEAKDNIIDYTEPTRQNQILWLVFQRNTCKDEVCLIREYKERLVGKPKLPAKWRGGDDIKPQDLPSSRAFGTFDKAQKISIYDSEAPKGYKTYTDTNSMDILSVTKKPYLAVIDSMMFFDNAHMCSITDQLATWSENHWTLTSYELDEPAELRLYPATYKGKPHILVKDINDQYRKFNCGMRGYFDGLLLQKK